MLEPSFVGLFTAVIWLLDLCTGVHEIWLSTQFNKTKQLKFEQFVFHIYPEVAAIQILLIVQAYTVFLFIQPKELFFN